MEFFTYCCDTCSANHLTNWYSKKLHLSGNLKLFEYDKNWTLVIQSDLSWVAIGVKE
jgi:hypothetical protein